MKKKLTAVLCLLALFAVTILGSACQTGQISTETDKPSGTPSETAKATEAPAESSTEAETAAPTIPEGFDGLLVGYGKRDITPTTSTPLAGYGDTFNRMSIALKDGPPTRMDDNGDGVVDENDGLFATCIVVQDQEGEKLLLISLDLVGVPDALLNKLYRKLSKAPYKVSSANIVVNCSHTHSAPDLGQYFSYVKAGDIDAVSYDGDMFNGSYQKLSEKNQVAVQNMQKFVHEVLIAGILGAVEDGLNDLSPATISTGTIEAPNFNYIRHVYDAPFTDDPGRVFGVNTRGGGTLVKQYGEVNDNLYLIQFTREGKSPVVAVDWRCHPNSASTGLSKFGMAYRWNVSSDYVNAFRHALELEGYQVSFFQGTGGNILPHSMVYTRTDNSRNPTNPEFALNYPLGGRGGRSVISWVYGQKLGEIALEGLRNNMEPASARGGVQTKRVGMSEDRDTSENYKMIGGNGVEGMLIETVPGYTNGDGSAMTVFQFLQAYYAYKDVTPATKPYLDKYGINSTYHLNRIKSKFDLTMQKSGDTYVQKADIKGNFAVGAISIGSDIGIVTAPFEIFDYPYTFRGEAFRMTFVLGYSNGSLGYMPTRDTFTFAEGKGAYEANNTAYAPGTAENIAAQHKKMLEELKESLPKE